MEELFNSLKLHRIKDVYKEYIEKASKEEMGYGEFLRLLLQDEQIYRQEKSMTRRLRQAGFPFEKTIDQFDFHLRPELHKQVFLNYLEDSFIINGRTICLIGPAGLGKTHLAISIGIKHIIRGYDASLAAALVDRLLHHGEVFYLSGESYRLRGKKIITSTPSKDNLQKKSISKV